MELAACEKTVLALKPMSRTVPTTVITRALRTHGTFYSTDPEKRGFPRVLSTIGAAVSAPELDGRQPNRSRKMWVVERTSESS